MLLEIENLPDELIVVPLMKRLILETLGTAQTEDTEKSLDKVK